MTLSTTRYSLMMVTQISVLIIDLIINSFAWFYINTEHYSVILLAIYLFQDVCIIFALMTLVLSFFTTYAFQAGMSVLLLSRDFATIFTIVVYLLLTIALQYWMLSVRWDEPNEYNWPYGMSVLYSLQRSASPFYYYLYKRSVLLMSDPQLYIDGPLTNNTKPRKLERRYEATLPIDD